MLVEKTKMDEWLKFAEDTQAHIQALQKRIRELTETNQALRMKLAGDDPLNKARAAINNAIESTNNILATLSK